MLIFDGELQIFKYYPKFVDDGIWVGSCFNLMMLVMTINCDDFGSIG